MQKALLHRYDNKPDILAVEKLGCSEVIPGRLGFDCLRKSRFFSLFRLNSG